MAYIKSSARSSFEDAISSLMEQKKAALKTGRRNHELCQLVYRAIIFQSSAALEEYLHDLLANWLYMLEQRQLTLREVPKEILALVIKRKQEPHFRKFLYDNDEACLLRSIISDQESAELYGADSGAGLVNMPKYLIYGKKYPSVNNVSSLFARFGILNIFERVGKSGKKDYKKLLQSFGDIRTEIAHQYPARDLTEADLKNQLDFLKGFVKDIDRVVYREVVQISGRLCWRTTVIA